MFSGNEGDPSIWNTCKLFYKSARIPNWIHGRLHAVHQHCGAFRGGKCYTNCDIKHQFDLVNFPGHELPRRLAIWIYSPIPRWLLGEARPPWVWWVGSSGKKNNFEVESQWMPSWLPSCVCYSLCCFKSWVLYGYNA